MIVDSSIAILIPDFNGSAEELFNPAWRLLLDFAVVFAILWLIRRAAALAGRRLGKLAVSWPVVEGTIEHAGPKVMGEGHTAYWVGELSYSYSVDGEYYAGVAYLPASTEDVAYEATRKWRDRKVQIRVNPGKPEQSILELDEQTLPIA